jgi:hypothetical protein
MSTKDDFTLKQIVTFYVVTFVFSWAFWVPQALHDMGLIPSSAFTDYLSTPFNVAAWGPLVGAVLTTLLCEGKDSTMNLLKRGTIWKFDWKLYLVVFLLFPAITILSLTIAVAFAGYDPLLQWIEMPFALLVAFVYILLLGGPLQEEFGWRGYALPRLQSRLDVVSSSLIVGLFWGLWHLPLFFISGQAYYYSQPIWGLMISTILISILFGWVFNNTKGSIFACLIFHTTFNWSHYAFPILESNVGATIFLGLAFILAAAVVIVSVYQQRFGEKN